MRFDGTPKKNPLKLDHIVWDKAFLMKHARVQNAGFELSMSDRQFCSSSSRTEACQCSQGICQMLY